ncbi:hypothetical protein M9H77_22151 [Catharanthus roseus]|uniref:Uncharacterized protein n=1 Tax=Catharanthus roseus TaxID=4058 RepID=A0ACC0ATQ1_CATRO|nr:hypothetical protein M9H77_22151 [Catharanthus roseus]
MVIHNNFIYHSREFFSTDIQFAMLYSFAGDDNMANLEIPQLAKRQFFGGSEISPSPPAPTASGNNAHMLYIFNRNGVCLSAQQDHKFMFGLLFSLKSLTTKMDPTSCFLPMNSVEKGNLGVTSYLDKSVHFTVSGQIILVTYPRTGDLRISLKYIYYLYVEYVVKDPLCSPGTQIKSELFNTNTLDQYVRGLGWSTSETESMDLYGIVAESEKITSTKMADDPWYNNPFLWSFDSINSRITATLFFASGNEHQML